MYDGDLLTAEIRGSRLSEYLYEPDSFVPLAKMESDAANDASILKLVVATKDKVEPALQKAKSFQLYYYQCDQIGAPQELTDEQGRVVWAAQYKVWGETQPLEFLKTGTDDAMTAVFSSNSRPLGLAQASDAQALNLVEQPLRFQGQYFDQETGLHYNRFRYYDPVTGRFVSQDPIGLLGGSNLFVYAPNVYSWADPLGLSKVDWGKHYRKIGGGEPPCGMTNPHAHHIVFKKGRGKMKNILAESKSILERHKIDWLKGKENLMWGQNTGHSAENTQKVLDALKAADKDGTGCTKDVEDALRKVGQEIWGLK